MPDKPDIDGCTCVPHDEGEGLLVSDSCPQHGRPTSHGVVSQEALAHVRGEHREHPSGECKACAREGVPLDRMLDVEFELERLRRIETAAREIAAAFPDYEWADLREALR